MSERGVTITLTPAEARYVRLCLSAEVECDDGHHGDYMKALRRVLAKLNKART